MRWIEKLVESNAGRMIACVVAVLLVGSAAYALHGFFGATPAEAAARNRLFICSETGKSFPHELQRGETVPIRSPYSGANTGYPAELCYWTAEGTVRDDPTPVLLKDYLGKREPTFCPDCGRLVVGHNPRPQPGSQPPPTHEQYSRSHRSGTAEARAEIGR